jgi:heptosyltransferase-2
LGAMGELLIMTPLLPALKKELNCEIYFMVKRGREDVFKNNPHVSQVLIYEDSFGENVKKLKKLKFDLAIDLFPASTKNAIICLFSKIKYRLGGANGMSGGPSFFFTKRIFPIVKKHVVEENLDIIRQIGINNKSPRIETYVTEKEKEQVQDKLNKLKIKDYVIIHPGFRFSPKEKYLSRLWPLERYSKVIDYISKKYKLKVLLTGLESEKEISKKILEKVKKKKGVIIMNGAFNYNELVALVSNAKLIICPDTLLVHIASSFNIKIIELMGRGGPKRWHPWNSKKNYKVLFHPEVCTECYRGICKKKMVECMNSITTKEVTNAINELIGKGKNEI